TRAAPRTRARLPREVTAAPGHLARWPGANLGSAGRNELVARHPALRVDELVVVAVARRVGRDVVLAVAPACHRRHAVRPAEQAQHRRSRERQKGYELRSRHRQTAFLELGAGQANERGAAGCYPPCRFAAWDCSDPTSTSSAPTSRIASAISRPISRIASVSRGVVA